MTEKDLIAQIKQLKEIKPRKDWVVFTKKQIFEGDAKVRSGLPVFGLNEVFDGLRVIFDHRFAFASLTVIIVLIGTFGFAQNSLPGNWLYSVRKATEQGQKPFISESEFNLKIAKNRLEDLSKVVHNNSTKNLAPAINEYQASVSQVARVITKDEIRKNPDTVKEMVKEVKNMEIKTAEIRSLGVEISENKELDLALVQLLMDQIKELENKTLTQDQLKILGEVKTEVEVGYYAEALEKLLILIQNSE